MRKVIILITVVAGGLRIASAQISINDAMRICRRQIQYAASARYSSSNLHFRQIRVAKDNGGQGQVEGTLAVRKDGETQIHTFACAVDFANGTMRAAKVDSQVVSESPNSSPIMPTGGSDAEAFDICRKVVRGRIRDHGYIAVVFDSIGMNHDSDGGESVSGKATGETGGHQNSFKFTCEVNPIDGSIKSVSLNGH